MEKKFRLIVPAVICGIAAAVTGCSPEWVAGPAPEPSDKAYVGPDTPAAPESVVVAAPEAPVIPAPKESPEVAVVEPQIEPVVQAPAPAPQEESIPRIADVRYTVQKGDTLSGIGAVYGVSAAELLAYNHLKDSGKLSIGQTILIPADKVSNTSAKPIEEVKAAPELKPVAEAKPAAPVTAGANQVIHTVKSGDMLSKIALQYHVRMADIAKANNMEINSVLKVGQKLVIPTDKAYKPSAKPAAAKKKPAAKKTSKPAAAVPAEKKAVEQPKPQAQPQAKPAADPSFDDLIGSPAAETTPAAPAEAPAAPAAPAVPEAPAAPAADASAAPAAPAPAAQPADDPVDTFTFKTTDEQSLEELAGIANCSVESLKKLNPTLDPNKKVEAGVDIIVPLSGK